MGNESIHISPNPFTEKTTITLSLQHETNVKIELFDNMGQHIKSIANFIAISNDYKQEINFQRLGLRPGLYFISVAIDGKVSNLKVEYIT